MMIIWQTRAERRRNWKPFTEIHGIIVAGIIVPFAEAGIVSPIDKQQP